MLLEFDRVDCRAGESIFLFPRSCVANIIVFASRPLNYSTTEETEATAGIFGRHVQLKLLHEKGMGQPVNSRTNKGDESRS